MGDRRPGGDGPLPGDYALSRRSVAATPLPLVFLWPEQGGSEPDAHVGVEGGGHVGGYVEKDEQQARCPGRVGHHFGEHRVEGQLVSVEPGDHGSVGAGFVERQTLGV
ncbi:MAG: hypothetical protein ACR2JC_21225 [Chloroflexota bacterium]